MIPPVAKATTVNIAGSRKKRRIERVLRLSYPECYISPESAMMAAFSNADKPPTPKEVVLWLKEFVLIQGKSMQSAKDMYESLEKEFNEEMEAEFGGVNF